MSNKSLSLLLGITLSLGVFATETLAYPNRVRFNPNAGVHRTIIAPNTRIGNSYPRGRYHNGGRSNSTFRERITIQRDQRETCYNCGYSNDAYSPRNYRGYRRTSGSIRNYRSYPYYR